MRQLTKQRCRDATSSPVLTFQPNHSFIYIYTTVLCRPSGPHQCSADAEMKVKPNLVARSHSVTGNVRSGKVRQYTIFHWPLKKGCGNAIYAPIGLFRGARNEGLVFASSCAVLNKYQVCGGKFCFFPTPEKLYSKGKSL